MLAKKKIIAHLKKVKEERGLTFKEISDITMENGEYVCESTIKKVFSENDKHNHDYNKTIKPIARVLIGDIDDDNYPIAGSYAAINEYKDAMIDRLENRITELKEQCKRLVKQKEEASHKHREHEAKLQEQIDFCKDQIKFKDSQIIRLNEAIDRKDKMIREKLIEEN